MIFLYLTNEEASKWLKNNGIFLYRDRNELVSVVAQKHKGEKVDWIGNPKNFIDKVEQNIAIPDSSPLLVEVVISDFKAYDERELEIQERKALIKELRKQSINFLNIEHAVLCKASQDKIIVFDLDSGEKHQVDAELTKDFDTCGLPFFRVEEAYNDQGVNQYKPKYERALKNWKSIKAK